MDKNLKMISSRQINDDLMTKRNHVEILNTIKRGNEDVKGTINKIVNFIQSDDFNLSIKKSRTSNIDNPKRLNTSFENEKIQTLEKSLHKERKKREDLEKTYNKEKAEKEHYEENIQTLERQLKNLKDILDKEKKEIEKLKKNIEKAKIEEKEKDIVDMKEFEILKNSTIIRNSILSKNAEKKEENNNFNDYEIGSSYIGGNDKIKKPQSKFKEKVIENKTKKNKPNDYNFER